MPEVFADTFYWIAILNPADKFHRAARTFGQISPESSLVTTDAVLTEVLNYFSQTGERMRQAAAALCEQNGTREYRRPSADTRSLCQRVRFV